MFSDKTFRLALIISATIHGALLFKPPYPPFFSNFKALNKIEITYLKLKSQQLIETKETVETVPKRQIGLRSDRKDYPKKLSPPPFIKKDDIFKESSPMLKKPYLAQTDIIAVKKIIQLEPLEINKINNPTYISYYQIVREKIRRCAYQNYTRSDIGQVYLTFVILSDGTLSDAMVMQDKSTANPYLKGIALKSIKDASPYPAFPKELEYPHLTFNVIISFEIE